MSTEAKTTKSFDMAYWVPPFLLLLATIPFFVALLPTVFLAAPISKLVWLSFAPLVAALTYCFLAGVLSTPFHAAIRPGKFPRDTKHVIYGPRRLYGLCWGAFFYSGPIYFAVMSVGFLRNFVFRLFGYKGHATANIAPDAWIRDLPVLDAAEGVYVANKSTIGTNMCLSNGMIFVDKVTLAKRSMVGHLVMVAPGTTVGEGSEIGVGAGVGIRAMLGSNVRIGPKTTINHGCMLGDRCDVGTMSYVGVKAVIGQGISLPPGANIPDGAEILTQDQVENYLSSETESLAAERRRLETLFMQATTPSDGSSVSMMKTARVGE